MLRTRIGKRSRLYIFGLVIQDHIESIGKPILLKGDEVLLMRFLLKMLSDIAPKTLIHFPQTHLSKTQLIISVPLSLHFQSHRDDHFHFHKPNPNKSDPPIWISVPPRWSGQLFVAYCNYFGLTEYAIGATEMA
jgi:hypothetical protein